MHIDALIARLGGGPVIDERGGVLVGCPAHNDGKPSLFVSLKPDGRALLYCRAGCATPDVLTAANLTEAELFGVTGTPTLSSAPVAELSPGDLAALGLYVRAAAERFAGSRAAVYAAERFGVTEDVGRALHLGDDDGTVDVGKARDFRTSGYLAHPRLVVPFLDTAGRPHGLQGRDLGNGCPARWLTLANPEGSRWGATAVMRTADSFTTVIVTEGPGDGLTVVAAGYTAVVVRGSGLARAERTAAEIAELVAQTGGDVVLAGDNDVSGRAFNAALGANLAALGVTARVLVIPPDAEDVADWRKRAGDLFAAALHRAVRDSPAWVPAVAPTDPDAPAEPPRPKVKATAGTDIENARLALTIVGEDTAHVDGVGFLTWDGRVWRVLSPTQERAIGHRVADAMARELAELPRGDKDGSREEQRQAEAYTEAVKRTRRMHMDAGIRAALEHLRTITGAEVDAFDVRHDLLTFRNGTVDLRTGILGEHRRGDRLTRYVDLDYDPDARCPRWERFLAEVFPHDPDMPAFMARLIGYGITGETREHVFALFYGHGSNGKSVLLNTLGEVFKGITGHMSQAAIAQARTFDPGAANPALAALRGVRLAVLSELSDGLRLNEALLKQLTAGDPVVARELYKGQFTFSPTALMLMATNYKPDVRGQDDGFWRRTRLVPFIREFSGADKDPRLPGVLLGEATGIAAWAVRGAVEWYAEGLREPDSVRAAVDEYRRSSDILDGFLPGVLVRDPGARMTLEDAFRSYEDWADVELGGTTKPWGKITFRKQLENRKISAVRTKAGMVLRGLRKATADDLAN